MNNQFSYKPLVVALLSVFFHTPAFADGNLQDEYIIDNIIVTATPPDRSVLNTFPSTLESLDEDKLLKLRSVSLGGTLEKVSGVHNQSFGPNNGLPQIRSLGGNRVQINENAVGVSDASAISPNFPSGIQPFLADSITVRKSSAAVLYGGHAIGGAVDVQTGQIPTQLPEKNIAGKVELSGGYNTPYNQLFRLDGKLGKWAWHLDGINSKISHYKIPGNSKARQCHDMDIAGNDVPLRVFCQVALNREWVFDHRGFQYVNTAYLNLDEMGRKNMLDSWELTLADVYSHYPAGYRSDNPDYVPGTPGSYWKKIGLEDIAPIETNKLSNSHFKDRSFSTGLSYIDDKGYIGFGFKRHLSEYGIPGFAAVSSQIQKTAYLPANVRFDQNIYTAQALYRPDISMIDNISAQVSYKKGQNGEYLGHYFSGSLDDKSTQSRLIVHHSPTNFWTGDLGADLYHRHTVSEGANRYLPNTQSRAYGFFLTEKFNFDFVDTEFGYRFETVRHTPHMNDFVPTRGKNTKLLAEANDKKFPFSLDSYYGAITLKPTSFLDIKARYNQSQRAPDINELFSAGKHFAILAHEHGDTRMKKERAKTMEFNADAHWKNTKISASHYRTRYEDYIYPGMTGTDKGDGMYYYEYRQGDTDISGWELSAQQQIDFQKYGILTAQVFMDKVKNYPVKKQDNDFRVNVEGEYMPLLPSSRYGIGLNWQKDNWQIDTSLTRYAAQKNRGKIINEEIDLGGYTLWDMYMSYEHSLGAHLNVQWFVDMRNLTNKEARAHNSPLKYLAPLPGRSVLTGIRLSF